VIGETAGHQVREQVRPHITPIDQGGRQGSGLELGLARLFVLHHNYFLVVFEDPDGRLLQLHFRADEAEKAFPTRVIPQLGRYLSLIEPVVDFFPGRGLVEDSGAATTGGAAWRGASRAWWRGRSGGFHRRRR
jgi:hypothetical protein